LSVEDIDVENITLRDIEVMVRILERFLKVSKRAERVVKDLAKSSLSRHGGFYGGGYQQFMQMFLQSALAGKIQQPQQQVVEEDLDLNDEEVKQVIAKIKNKSKT